MNQENKETNPNKEIADNSELQKKSKFPKLKLPVIKIFNKKVLIVLIIALALAGLYFIRGAFVAAVVNGKPITRISVINALERSQGEQTLENLIIETLVEQEAKRENVTVTQEEIDTEISGLEQNFTSQGTNLEDALEQSGITLEELERQITLQKQLEKILNERVTVTEEEINEYITANEEFLPEDVSEEELRTQVKETIQQQKLNTEYQNWLQEARNRSNILYFVRY